MSKIEFVALSDGTVEIVLGSERITVPAENVGNIAAELLAAAQRASILSGFTPKDNWEPLHGIFSLRPSRLGLSLGKPPEPQALVVHAGKARLGIALEGSTKSWLLSALREAERGGGHQH